VTNPGRDGWRPRGGDGRPSALGALDRALEAALAACVAASALAILGQVAMRYLFDAPVSWAEEVAVLAFAWLVFLGAARAQRDDSHLSVDLLRRRFSGRAGRLMDAGRLLAVGLCSAVLVDQGTRLALRTLPLAYPATGVSRACLYGSVPVCFGLGLVYVLARLWRLRCGTA
jgi:TRAP-type transport system small permease protein